MKTNERKKGISLIVLIITILVMIILAAAIILNIDDTKIINKADKAVADNDVAVAKEIRVVAKAEWRVNEEKLRKEEGFTSFQAYLDSKIKDAGLEGKVEITESGKIYVMPVIPYGFVASKATGEDKVANGLVIYETTNAVTNENVDEAKRAYNQYVWVPVESMEDYKLVDWDNAKYFGTRISHDTSDVVEVDRFNATRQSIEKHGGFYIGRYEAGKETIDGVDTLVSKKNVLAWNKISWAESKEKAESVVGKEVVGHLLYGEEWDAALTFISKTDSEYPKNSMNRGWDINNYKPDNKEHKTGVDLGTNAANKVCNIYDMAGSMTEWVMEAYGGYHAKIGRGGSWAETTDKIIAGRRVYIGGNSDGTTWYGFRVALYLK